MVWDYAIVGAGPTGLTCCYILEKIGKKCIIFDDNPGGCHRSSFKDSLFYEHSPRVYSGAYVNMIQILNSMGLSFDKLFVKYDTLISLKDVSYREMFIIFKYFISGILYKYDDFSIANMMHHEGFTSEGYKAIDHICMVTDGVDATRYPLSKFMNLINQQSFRTLYKTKEPNTMNKIFKPTNLVKERVFQIVENSDVILNKKYYAKKVLVCVPPAAFNRIYYKNKLPNDIVVDTQYNTFISATLHTRKKIVVPKTATRWNFVYMEMPNSFGDNNVISCYLPHLDIVGLYKKTARQCNNEELIEELKAQLGLPSTTMGIVNDVRNDTYCKTPNNNYIDPRITSKVYSVGTHNGNSPFDFTTFESACANAIHVTGQLELTDFKVKYPWTIRQILYISLIFIIIIIFGTSAYTKFAYASVVNFLYNYFYILS